MKIAGLFSFNWETLWICFILGILGEHAHAQCAKLQVVYQSRSGSASQCVFELCNNNPYVPPQFYLQDQYVFSFFVVVDQIIPSSFVHEAASFVTTSTSSYSVGGCSKVPGPENGSANYQYSDYEGANGTESASEVNGAWSESDGGQAQDDAVNFFNGSGGAAFVDCGCGTQTYACSATDQSDISAASYGDADWQGSINVASTHNLSVDATSVVRSEAISSIPTFSNPLTTNGPCSFGSASYTLSSALISGNYVATAACSKFEFFFHITFCQPNQTYLVTWYQYTINAYFVGPIQPQKMTEEISGSGDPVAGVNGTTHTVDVPGTPGTTIWESDPTVTVISQSNPGQ